MQSNEALGLANTDGWEETRSYDEMEELARMYEKSWYQWTLMSLITIKVVVILIICCLAIRAFLLKKIVPHKKKVISILCLNIIVLIGKLHFMYSRKLIFMFFFWSWAANVVSTYALGVLLVNVWVAPGLTLFRRYRLYF